MKIRLLSDLPIYDTADATEPAEQLSADTVFEMNANIQGANRHEVILPDGRRKYISAEGMKEGVNALFFSLFTVGKFGAVVKVFAQPDALSPVIAELNYGEAFERKGLATELNGRQWYPVGLRDGRSGYIDGTEPKFVDHGAEVRIEDNSSHQSREGVVKNHKLRRFDVWRSTPRQDAVFEMKLWGIWCGVLVVTIGVLTAAMSIGVLYVVLSALLLFGGYGFVQSVIKYRKSLHTPSPQ